MVRSDCVGAEQFTLFNSIWMIAMLIVGGMGSVIGGLCGVVVIVGILTDVVYTMLDPRVDLGSKERA